MTHYEICSAVSRDDLELKVLDFKAENPKIKLRLERYLIKDSSVTGRLFCWDARG